MRYKLNIGAVEVWLPGYTKEEAISITDKTATQNKRLCVTLSRRDDMGLMKPVYIYSPYTGIRFYDNSGRLLK